LHFSRFYQLGHEASWLILGQAIGLFGSFLFIRLVTDLVTPAEYGRLALALTVFTLFSQLIAGFIANGASRSFSDARSINQLGSFYQACGSLLLAGSVFIVLLSIPLAFASHHLDIGLSTNLVLCIGAYAVLHSYYSVFLAIQSAARNRREIAICTAADVGLRSICALAVVVWFADSSAGIVFGFALGSFLMIAILSVMYRHAFIDTAKDTQSADHKQWVRAMCAYSWPLAISGVFNWSYYASQRWSLETFSTTTEVGEFYLLTQIGYAPISAIGASLVSFVSPILYNRAAVANYQNELLKIYSTLKRIVCLVAVTLFFGFILLVFFSNEVIGWIANEKYQSVASILPLIMLAASLLVVSHLLGVIVGVKKLTRLFLIRDSVGNLIIAIANIFSVYFFGLQGLAFSMIIGATLHLISQYLIVRVALRQ
jgi:O-antigen/teichoic acid export membrane protein